GEEQPQSKLSNVLTPTQHVFMRPSKPSNRKNGKENHRKDMVSACGRRLPLNPKVNVLDRARCRLIAWIVITEKLAGPKIVRWADATRLAAEFQRGFPEGGGFLFLKGSDNRN